LEALKPITDTIEKFKDKFGIGNRKVIGIDIGLSAVKIAELTGDYQNEKYVLNRYKSLPLPEGAIIEDEIQKREEIIEIIREGIEELGLKTESACLGLAGPNTVARKLQLAGGSEEEIEDQVMWEAEQYLPFEIDDSKISFHIMGENEGGGVDVIVAAIRGDVLDSYKELVEEADVKVKIADLGVIAIVNMFEMLHDYDADDEGQTGTDTYLLLDFGAQKTQFVIYKRGMINFTKEINVGGVMITEEIQRQLGVTYDEAEDLKIRGDEGGNLPEEIVGIIDDVVEMFFSEIKKTIDFYQSSSSDESMDGCVVTGGGVLIPGLVEGLEALLGVEVSVLNPFEKITYNSKNISEEEINEIAYRGVTVLGLALRSK